MDWRAPRSPFGEIMRSPYSADSHVVRYVRLTSNIHGDDAAVSSGFGVRPLSFY